MASAIVILIKLIFFFYYLFRDNYYYLNIIKNILRVKFFMSSYRWGIKWAILKCLLECIVKSLLIFFFIIGIYHITIFYYLKKKNKFFDVMGFLTV